MDTPTTEKKLWVEIKKMEKVIKKQEDLLYSAMIAMARCETCCSMIFDYLEDKRREGL